VVGMPSHEDQIFCPTWQFDEDDDNYDYDWNGDNLNHDYNDNDGYDYNGDNDDYNGSYNGDSDAMDDKDDDAVVDVATKDTRQAYSREYKIAVLDWHHENGSVKNKTARQFKISRQNVLRWICKEVDIRAGKKGSKGSGSGRHAMYPALEIRLHGEFLELRNKGIKIRNIWFMMR